jgi:transcription elongation GreA/GreB family factor
MSMSRAFVNEDAQSKAQAELPERPQSPHPNYVTPEGLAALERRLASLLAERSALSDDGDALSYEEALRRIDRNTRYVSVRIDRAVLVNPDEQPRDEVAFGASVRVCDADGEERVFTIVGEDEADVAVGKVSWVSPLANALLGARVEDVVTWGRPNGNVDLEVLSITYPPPDTPKSTGGDSDP